MRSALGLADPGLLLFLRLWKFPANLDFAEGKSESGYFNFETFYEYMLKTFDTWLDDNHVERPVIVFTDWYETRCNRYLSQSLDAKQIIINRTFTKYYTHTTTH